MTTTLANAEPMVLMSVLKPLVMAVVLLVWARFVIYLHHDAIVIYPSQPSWTAAQVAAGVVGFGLWLLLPLFWIGGMIALAVIGTATGSYAHYRNQKVPIRQRWTWKTFRTAMLSRPGNTAAPPPDGFVSRLAHPTRAVDPDQVTVEAPVSQDPLSQPHHQFEKLLEHALSHHADRIELTANNQSSSVTLRIDGVTYPQNTLDTEGVVAVIDYLKLRSGLDVSERRKKLLGKLKIDVGRFGKHDLALVTSGSMRGLEMTIDIDPQTRHRHPFDQLGFTSSQKSHLDVCLSQGNRVILVACPPEHGQTTLLYTLLSRHDPYTQSVVTLEDDIAFEIDGTTQQAAPPGATAQELAQSVAAILRQDPNVLMLSCGLSPPVAQTIAGSAQEVLIYAGTRHEDTFTALRDWIKQVGNPLTAANALGAVVAGRLLRRLCPACRVEYTPHQNMLRKLNLSANRISKLYKHSGKLNSGHHHERCPDCMGLGYHGQVGVYEVMALDDQARQLIAEGQLDPLRAHLRKQKMLLLHEAAVMKAAEGATTISEIKRVLGGQASEGPSPDMTPQSPTKT